MNTTLSRALLFALLPLGMVVVSDVLFAGPFGIARQDAASGERVVVHAAAWAAVFVLSALGALLAFGVFRGRVPSRAAVFIAAQLFAIASFYAIFLAFTLGGLWASGAWLLFGAFVFAAAAAALSPRHDS
jgi:hypothetical protein